MRVRDIKGKRVEGVRQARRTTNYGEPVWDVQEISFEDGTMLSFTVAELEGDYAVEGTIYRKAVRR